MLLDYKFVRQVAIEDYELCENAQYNLEKGIYAEGVLNTHKETGVACKFTFISIFPTHVSQSAKFANLSSIDYQQRVLEMVLEQHQKEQKERATDIRRQLGENSEVSSQSGKLVAVTV